jgi:hypothetical protein
MNSKIGVSILVAATLVLLAGAGTTRADDDDLAVVKKAVAPQAARETTAAPEAARSTPAAKAQWLKIRVVEKGGKNARVTVNLPLALVRALGDDWPAQWGCRDGRRSERCGLKMAEVLEALESGQQIVEIDDEENTVRVWVE